MSRPDHKEISIGGLPETGDELFNAAPCGILYIAPNGLILRCNPELLQWTGYSRGEVEGRLRLHDLLNSGGKIFYETHIALLLKVNGRVNGLTLDLVGKNRNVIPVLLNATLLKNTAGTAWFSRIILFDARDRRSYESELLAARKQAECDATLLEQRNEQLKRAEAELGRRVTQLERTNEDLVHFAYAVSHDLKTPLRTVTSFVQLLELTYKDKLDAQGGEFIDFIVSGVTRMSTMLADLLQVAQAAGGPRQVLSETPLAEAVATSLLSLRSAIDEAHASITYDDLPVVTGDPSQFTRLFQNLIGNSIKYRKADVAPVIHISSERKGSDWLISLRDNGIGFAPESAAQIFRVFQRLNNEEVEGTGIGLAICQRIVERNGGRIWAAGQPGEGAIFSFTIPTEASTAERENGEPVSVMHAEPIGVATPLSDPTDRHFGELFNVLDVTQAMVSKLDGAIQIWTRSSEQFFGWSKTEAIGKISEELLKTEFPKPLPEIKSILLRNGEWSGEVKRFGRDGRAIWLLCHWSLYRDGSGRPQSVIEVYADITARKQQELDERLLLELVSKLAQISNREELAGAAAKSLGEYLSVSRALYAEIDTASGTYESLTWLSGIGQPILDSRTLDVFGDFLADFEGNRPVIIRDTQTDPRTSLQYDAYKNDAIRSFISIPLHREGRWVASLAMADETPRDWEPREVALVRDAGERLWPAMENARLQQMYRQRQEQFEATFNQAAVGIAHNAFDGRWLRVNRRLCEITGYTEQELLASDFQAITHPEDLEKDLHQFAALQLGEIHSYSIEKRYFHKNGSTVWINLTVSLVRPDSNIEGYAISVIEDITARKRIEHDLNNSVALAAFRLDEIESIYANAPVGLASVDADLRFIRVNEYFASIEGASPADYVGRTLHETSPELAPIYQGVIDSGRSVVNLELQHAPANSPDRERTYLLSYYPLRGAKGGVLGVNAVLQDITDRKLAEKAWIESAERLQIATTAAHLGVFDWDVPQDCIYWENDRAYEIFGRSREDGVFSPAYFFTSVVHPDDRGNLEKALAEAWREGRRVHNECHIYRKDGALRIVEIFGIASITADGAPLRFTGVIADITERKQSEQHQQIVFELAPVGMCYIDMDLRFTKVNQKLCEITGYPEAEMIGMTVARLTHPDDLETHEANLANYLQLGAPTYQMEKRYLRKDGSVRWISATGRRILNPEGRQLYSIGVVEDIHDRKMAEEAVREFDQNFRLLAESAPIGICRTDAHGGIVYVNQVWCAMTGLSESESMGSGWALAIHPEDRTEAVATWMAAAATGSTWVHRHRIITTSGIIRWVEARSSPTTSPNGELSGHVGTVADITDWKLAEESLAERDRQLLSMMDSIDQLAWIAHPDGYIFWYNQRWYDYTGTTPEQMEGWGWQSVHDPKVLPEVLERWPAAIRNGEPFDMEFPLRGSDGVYRSFLTRAIPVRDAEGRVVRWFGTNTNVDALRKQQDILLESERRFRELAERLPDFIWVADAQGKLVYLSPRWRMYTGIPDEVSLADSWALRITHPDDIEVYLAQWRASIETGQPFLNESRIRRRDGMCRWFLSHAEPVKDDNGEIVKWIGSATDIHEQKNTEQALRRSSEDLEQFAFAASHDLREPLRMVSIYSQLLAETYGSKGAEAETFVHYVVEGVSRMNNLLQGILDFSRAGDSSERVQQINSGAVLSQVMSQLEATLAESQTIVTHDPLPVVTCAETHVHQLLRNLIANAMKYRAERPLRIHVSATREGRRWRFSIKDNGIGIAPEYLDQIFGMFKRLHKSEYPGVGIGLAICKRIVERYYCSIWAESNLGQGATFHFTLPALLEPFAAEVGN